MRSWFWENVLWFQGTTISSPMTQESWFVQEQWLVSGRGGQGEGSHRNEGQQLEVTVVWGLSLNCKKISCSQALPAPRGFKALLSHWAEANSTPPATAREWNPSAVTCTWIHLASRWFWWLFWWAAEGLQDPAETVNEIFSPWVTHLFIPISLWMMLCHWPPQAAISVVYQCQCDRNANDDAGRAAPDSLRAGGDGHMSDQAWDSREHLTSPLLAQEDPRRRISHSGEQDYGGWLDSRIIFGVSEDCDCQKIPVNFHTWDHVLLACPRGVRSSQQSGSGALPENFALGKFTCTSPESPRFRSRVGKHWYECFSYKKVPETELKHNSEKSMCVPYTLCYLS